MRSSNSACTRICVATLLAVSVATQPLTGHAQSNTPLAEAKALLQQGQPNQALEKVERILSTNPKDRQALFLKGVILTEMKKLDEAAAVFTRLTEVAPELPEPYNNLAVIYAHQKQYDKAKAALNMAMRTNQSYAVAQENLSDLYAKMARQAYDRALQIDSNSTSNQANLSLLRELTPGPSRPSAVIAAAPPKVPVPQTPLPAATKPVAPVTAMPSASAQTPTAKPSPTSIASAPTGKQAPTITPAKPSEDGKLAVRSAVQSWASAWSNKNVKEYLAFYARDFQVPDKKSRKAWETERTQRVGKPGNIKVSLSDIDVKINGDRATVRFKQHYGSSTFNSESGKTLELVQNNGHWQILQERIGR
jgi:tetratricopeptide (TPR) repeat protein